MFVKAISLCELMVKRWSLNIPQAIKFPVEEPSCKRIEVLRPCVENYFHELIHTDPLEKCLIGSLSERSWQRNSDLCWWSDRNYIFPWKQRRCHINWERSKDFGWSCQSTFAILFWVIMRRSRDYVFIFNYWRRVEIPWGASPTPIRFCMVDLWHKRNQSLDIYA